MLNSEAINFIVRIKDIVGNNPDKAMEELKKSNPRFNEFTQKSLDDIASEYNVNVDMIRRLMM